MNIINRPYLFLIFTMFAFFAPLLLYGTSLTFIVIVPFTILIWFIARWQEITEIENRSNLKEILTASAIYSLNIVRNALGFSGSFQGMGLFDMLIAFVAVCVAFYGFKGLKHFILPTVYLSVLIGGYYLEFTFTKVAFLENFLANLITGILNTFGILATTENNIVTLSSMNGNVYMLLVDATCTGIKGMLAYGSLAILMIVDVKTSFKHKLFWAAIGIIGTFMVNILRLLSIFLAAYFLEIDTAMAIHTYLGYGLFIVWILIFWTIALNFILPPTIKTVAKKNTIGPYGTKI